MQRIPSIIYRIYRRMCQTHPKGMMEVSSAPGALTLPSSKKYIFPMRPHRSGTSKKSISVALSPARPDKTYAVHLLMVLCALAEIYYSRPQAVKHSRMANLQVGRTAFDKGRATNIFHIICKKICIDN